MSDERGAELQPGQRSNICEIVRPLGKGAFGALFVAAQSGRGGERRAALTCISGPGAVGVPRLAHTACTP